MTEPHTFLPGDDDPLAGVQANPSSAAPDAVVPAPARGGVEPFGQPARAAARPYVYDPAANAAERLAVFDEVHGRGVSNELNKYGQYALFFGVVSLGASVILYLGAGLWWLNIGLGITGIYFGIRGYRAARRRLATNGGLALAGAVISGLGILATLTYLIIIAIAVAAFLGGVGSV